MDILIKQRAPVRANFTKLYQSLKTLFDDNDMIDQIKVKFSSFERLFNNLSELDNKVLELLLNDESDTKYADEFEIVESYREKFDEIKTRVKFLTQNSDFEQQTAVVKTNLKLPKIELIQFSGEIKDWLTFWSQFSRIHEDKSLEEVDKFHYLIQCMSPGSRAKEIIDSYPPTAENYSKAIESLKARFGREELLVEFYVRELLSLVVKNATSTKIKSNIVHLYDKLESYLRSLESIGMTSDKYSAMLFPLVESCIPEDLLRVWLRNPVLNTSESSYGDKLSQLLSFLRIEVEGEERVSMAKIGINQNNVTQRKQKFRVVESSPTANDLLSKVKKGTVLRCLFCDKAHDTKDCFKGQNLSLEEKQNILKRNKTCFSCLKTGHLSKNCKAYVKCVICGKKHWPIMCCELKHNSKTPIEDDSKCNSDSTLSNYSGSAEVLLQTLLVNVEVNGKQSSVRALIDTGSQRSYILASTAERLGLKPIRSEFLNHTVFGGSTSKRKHKCFTLKINEFRGNYSCNIEVLDQPIICGSVPRMKKGICFRELQANGIQLHDVGTASPPIELLIGADYAGKLFLGLTYQLKCGLVAMKTHLGWLIMGKPDIKCVNNCVTSLLAQCDDITNLWNLEAIGINDPCERIKYEELEQAALHHFRKTVHINEDGRYEVSLPWVENKVDLPSNREGAERRLRATTSKLRRNGKLNAYDEVFKEWLADGIIEESEEGPGHYLPHRGVFKENSTTKTRPVFDASFKQTKKNLSLNDCLLKGPNFLEEIPSVLMKFRQEKIGVTSDIKKAFLQISIDKPDREYLKFLWYDKEGQKKIFQHCRVVFGLNCSPFLLNAVIRFHLEKAYSSFNSESLIRKIVEKLSNSFYVDNCVTSVKTKEELKQFIDISTKVMAEAKFDLRGWEHTVLQEPKCFTEGSCTESNISSVLGLMWNRSTDTLSCYIPTTDINQITVTRRSILSVAQKVFDPIGFSCPVTLLPKLMLQASWKSKLSWDSEVPDDIRRKFLKWLEDLPLLRLVEIPRHALLDDCSEMSLHTFSDASGISYAAVVYLRCQSNQNVSVQLLMSKSRVAPLKEISIPRLELLSCLLGSRLAAFVKGSLKLQNIKEYFWTDSTTALQWIKNDDSWGVFVRNRVNEIRKLTQVEDWRHIPGKYNPADLPSRGCSASKLLSSRWWEGPTWLRLPEKNWPESETTFNEDEVLMEKKKCTTLVVNETLASDNILSYFSSYTKVIRMIGWILRFLFNSKNQKNQRTGNLTVSEINEAEKRIVKIIQNETFTEDYVRSLKSLNVFKDEEGIFRIKTKLTERNDTHDFRFPIIIPGKHRITELLIRETHLKMMHAGIQILLSCLREKFWIINGRRSVRQVINRCVRCKRHNSKPFETPPAPLPEDRIKDASIFEVVGVDLAGPLILKGGEKSWIVLYTCAIYRAIHLELITCLSTKAFLLSLRRFIARRGRPNIIYSDNGLNFVGTANLFQSIDWSVVEQEATLKRIQWKFNPPTAAWWGGFWERLIGIMKNLLRRVLGRASLNYEELMSVLCECEAVVNSRPLTYISEDPDSLIPLTPSMFLQDIQTIEVADLNLIDKHDLKKRWRYLQTLRENLRKRFRLEYLGQLLQHKRHRQHLQIHVNDIVLVESDSRKRTFWPLAKVLELYTGKDGNIRVARLKTSSGEIIRPVRKLYPLEIEGSSQVSDEQSSNSFSSAPELPLEQHVPNSPTSNRDSLTDQASKSEHPSIPVFLREDKSVTTRSGRTVKLPARFRQDYM